jgi:uncharacterized protein (DUF1800 family)
MTPEASIALNRFGLGARADDGPPGQPKRWLLEQMDHFEPRPAPIAAAPGRAQVAGELADYVEELRGARMQGKTMPGEAAQPPQDNDAAKALRQAVRKAGADSYVALAGARMQAALETPAPFIERLVHFWANHFAVSADKLTVIGLAGLLEFEAIRPHVLGRFADMLNAVERHPAMLLYLDQAQSVGPSSPLGGRAAARNPQRKIGLNENLAREIMELHTLGVRTGYTQTDVTEFARALTGWTVSGITRGPVARLIGLDANPGEFVFVPALHEPGARTIMGKSYAQPGEAQASAVLADLAVQPATARHIAAKLARHFAADDPSPTLVARLEQAFLKSGGDLPEVYRVLVEAPEVWTGPGRFKSPWDWTVSALRGVGARNLPPMQTVNLLKQLGQPVWRPGSPAGFDDLDASWLGPDALMRRVEAAERLAQRASGALDALTLGPKLIALGPTTEQAIARAESPGQGLALLLVAPEFMRR